MRTAATSISVVRRRNSGWRSVTWILLLAFSLQSYVTQTHIHLTPQAVDRAAAGKLVASTPAHNKSPADDGTGACPFCQAVANAGAFFAPAAPLLLPPALWAASIVLPFLADAVGGTTAHGWHSRAPPQL